MKRTRDEEMCDCMKPVIKRTVTKDSGNKGRTFWSCQSRGCSYFQWGLDRRKNWLQLAQDKAREKQKKRVKVAGCHCKQGPRRMETLKAGPNEGRWFLSCRPCDFFQWDSPVVVRALLEETAEAPRALPVPDYTITI